MQLQELQIVIVDPVIHNAEPQQSDIGDNDTIMNWL